LKLIGIAILGILSGGIVNVLADDLPYRRRLRQPAYPDGTPRPIPAWLGITAFLLKLRLPADHHTGAPKLGWRYPLTEIVTAALMVAAAVIMGGTADVPGGQMLVWLIYIALLMLIIIIDLEHQRIMFVYILPAAVLALLDALLFPNPLPTLASALVGGGFGFVVFYIIYLGGHLFRHLMGRVRGENMDALAFGFGDVMTISLSGLMLGFENVILVMFLAIFLGGGGAALYLVIRPYRPFTAIPYGPYIVAATIIVMFFGAELRSLLLGY